MSEYVPQKLRRKVIERSKGICEYCYTQAAFSSQPFAIEHIIPVVTGGKTILSNLAFSCQGCNGHKYTHTAALDPVTRKIVPLFHPRRQKWNDHFTWNNNFTLIIGQTPVGRVTVELMQLNREGCVNIRRAVYTLGEHPPHI